MLSPVEKKRHGVSSRKCKREIDRLDFCNYLVRLASRGEFFGTVAIVFMSKPVGAPPPVDGRTAFVQRVAY